MQSMIILASALCLAQAFYAGPPAHVALTPDGKYLQDTPEVAHAKAAHFSAVAQASHGHAAWAPHGGAWAGAPAHYAAGAHYGAPAAGLHKYGPAPLAHDGRVVDTPEVAHLKAAHHAAHHAAAAGAHHAAPLYHHAAPAPIAHGYDGGYDGGYAHGHGYGKWAGPIAHIQLTHDGQYVVDTPEVQHARAAHLAQYAHAAAEAAAHPEEAWGHGHGHGWQ